MHGLGPTAAPPHPTSPLPHPTPHPVPCRSAPARKVIETMAEGDQVLLYTSHRGKVRRVGRGVGRVGVGVR